MRELTLHRFERDGRRFVLDPESCFCFECDGVSWAVTALYPHEPMNRIVHLLKDEFPATEVEEVIGELEWLRASKSILSPTKLEDEEKRYAIEPGLTDLYVDVRHEDATRDVKPVGELLRSAMTLLLTRSAAQPKLRLTVRFSCNAGDTPADAELDEAIQGARSIAAASGKPCTIEVIADASTGGAAPAALAGCDVRYAGVLGDARSVAGIRKASRSGLKTVLKFLKPIEAGRVLFTPAMPDWRAAMETLWGSGAVYVALDWTAAMTRETFADRNAMREFYRSLCDETASYVEKAARGGALRFEPAMSVFLRVYDGTPERRTDPAGLRSLAIDAAGGVYATRHDLGRSDKRLGWIEDGPLDEPQLARYADVGSLTTAECRSCWARYLCGGGAAAVHEARTGSIRRPDPAWCDAQRDWIEAAIAAFQRLQSHGVDIHALTQTTKAGARPSFRQMARVMTRGMLRVRPIAEADAEWLARWARWNTAAYFALSVDGVLLTTVYDKEMDALHPRGVDQELVLQRANGDAIGLVRIRPEREGVATLWVYLRDTADYASGAVRRGFKNLLQELPAGETVRQVLAPVGPDEDELAAFLHAVGFTPVGVERQGLYLHGAYHDVRVLGFKK